MVAPACLRTEGMRYALDNGAWGAHVSGRAWDQDAFLRSVLELGGGADFMVVPDVVGDGRASLRRSLTWLPWLIGRCHRLLLPVQDGMRAADVSALLGETVGTL